MGLREKERKKRQTDRVYGVWMDGWMDGYDRDRKKRGSIDLKKKIKKKKS